MNGRDELGVTVFFAELPPFQSGKFTQLCESKDIGTPDTSTGLIYVTNNEVQKLTYRLLCLSNMPINSEQ